MTLSDSWIPQWSVPGHAWAGNLIRLDYNRPWAINCRQGSAVAFMTSMKTCFNERYKTGIGWCWEGETYLIYGKWMIERSLTETISALLSAIYSELSMVMSSGPEYWLPFQCSAFITPPGDSNIQICAFYWLSLYLPRIWTWTPSLYRFTTLLLLILPWCYLHKSNQNTQPLILNLHLHDMMIQ